MQMILYNRLVALSTLMQDRLEDRFDEFSPRAVAVLIMLLNRGTLTVSRLAAIAGIAQPTATRLVDGLAARGLVARGHGDRWGGDGRRVMVALTQAGRRQALLIQRKRNAIAKELLGPLSAKERSMLQELTDKMLYAATTSRASARTTCRYCSLSLCTQADCPVDRRATEIESVE